MYKDDPIANGWLKLVEIYKETRGHTPITTAAKFINAVGLESAIQVVSAIAGLKRHDGRIYGDNRNWTDNNIAKYMLLLYTEHDRSNPLLSVGHLDDIHTAHLNQIITHIRTYATETAPTFSDIKDEIEKLWELFGAYADSLQAEDWENCEIQFQRVKDELDIMENGKAVTMA